jgi:hypothetical protein
VDPADVAKVAARAGQVEVLRFALDLGWKIYVGEFLRAAAAADLGSEKRLQILSLVRDTDPTSLRPTLPDFAGCGDVPCVQLLLRLCHFDSHQLNYAVEQAAARGHIAVMATLLENGASLTVRAFQWSATVAVLRWCVQRGCTVDEDCVEAAAFAGRLFQLEWAASVMNVSGFLTAALFADVAACGDMPVMEWLRAQGCPWGSSVLTEAWAAYRGSCVAFALRHGCRLDGFELSGLGVLTLDELKAAVQALHDNGRGEAVNPTELFSGTKRAEMSRLQSGSSATSASPSAQATARGGGTGRSGMLLQRKATCGRCSTCTRKACTHRDQRTRGQR